MPAWSVSNVVCCGELDDSNAVDRGLLWLGKQFSVRKNPGERSWLLYYLYGVERVGRLTGRRFIGRHDWYREGAELLVREQDDFEDTGEVWGRRRAIRWSAPPSPCCFSPKDVVRW